MREGVVERGDTLGTHAALKTSTSKESAQYNQLAARHKQHVQHLRNALAGYSPAPAAAASCTTASRSVSLYSSNDTRPTARSLAYLQVSRVEMRRRRTRDGKGDATRCCAMREGVV